METKSSGILIGASSCGLYLGWAEIRGHGDRHFFGVSRWVYYGPFWRYIFLYIGSKLFLILLRYNPEWSVVDGESIPQVYFFLSDLARQISLAGKSVRTVVVFFANAHNSYNASFCAIYIAA